MTTLLFLALTACDESAMWRPVADAGEDIRAQLGQPVSVSGQWSEDPDGDIVAYAWRVISAPTGSSAWPIGTDDVVLELTPDQEGIWSLGLVVFDNVGSASAMDVVNVVVDPVDAAPVASLEASWSGGAYTLDASGSTDPEGAPLELDWSVVLAPEGATPALEIVGEQARFMGDATGFYVIGVTARDGIGRSQRADWIVRWPREETR